MVKIRLKRVGKKKSPFYRLVIADSRCPRDGRFIETIGTYNPRKNPSEVTLKEGRVRYWLDRGAQPTDTVRSILKNNGVTPKSQINLQQPSAAQATTEPSAT